MKALFVTTILLSLMSFQKGQMDTSTLKINTLTGTYSGMDDDGSYLFKDAAGVTTTFVELGDDVNYDYLEEEYIGKKFTVNWTLVDSDVYDDEGDPTGETEKVKQIVSLALAK